jgi:hypothetical protein
MIDDPNPGTAVTTAAEPGAGAGTGPSEWTAERVADLLDELNTGQEFLVYQLDLIAGQRAWWSAVVIRQLQHVVSRYRPADAARTQLAGLTSAELFAGLEVFAARRVAHRGAGPVEPARPPLLQVHRGGLG